MSTLIDPLPDLSAATVPAGNQEQRFVLSNVGWAAYDVLLTEVDHRRTRLTYDGRNLELMSPSRWHEVVRTLLGRFIALLALERDIPISSGGSMTFRRPDLLRGLEPDECYWIANAARVAGRRDLDFVTDPPPDLAIEVEITHSALDRLGIYAQLEVPEIWRYDGARLHVLLLQNDNSYAPSESSRAFPFLPVAELVRFLPTDPAMNETACVRQFLEWVRRGSQGP